MKQSSCTSSIIVPGDRCVRLYLPAVKPCQSHGSKAVSPGRVYSTEHVQLGPVPFVPQRQLPYRVNCTHLSLSTARLLIDSQWHSQDPLCQLRQDRFKKKERHQTFKSLIFSVIKMRLREKNGKYFETKKIFLPHLSNVSLP